MIDAKEHELIKHALEHPAIVTIGNQAVRRPGVFSCIADGSDDKIWQSLAARGLAKSVTFEGAHVVTHLKWWEPTMIGRIACMLFGARDGLGNPLIAHHDYFIQDASQMASDSARFWRPNRYGYTSDLEDAGIYSGADAATIVNGFASDRADVAWPVEHVRKLARSQVPRDELVWNRPPHETNRNPCCGNRGTHGEGGIEYCSTCGQVVEERKR